MPDKYLTKEELKHVIPSGKKILRDEEWDRRYENYWIGVTPPDTSEHVPPDIWYWYDVATDCVKTFSSTAGWRPCDPLVPKLAFETRTWQHVGRVEEEAAAPVRSLTDLLNDDVDEI